MKIEDLKPDPMNANRGTPRGRKLVEKSLESYGAGRSILVDSKGVIIAGNKTIEGAKKVGKKKLRVVQTTGDEIVVVQRTDLDLSTDKKARMLAIADNRTAELGLAWDDEKLRGLDLAPFWTPQEAIDIPASQNRPKKCEVCKTTDQNRTYDWVCMTGDKDNPRAYKRLCRSCRAIRDGRAKNLRK